MQITSSVAGTFVGTPITYPFMWISSILVGNMFISVDEFNKNLFENIPFILGIFSFNKAFHMVICYWKYFSWINFIIFIVFSFKKISYFI